MAIYRLLKNSTLEPEEISRITEAYEQALHTLSRSMRLTQKSVMPPRTAHPVNRHRNPWEPEPEDEEAT
jgi:hypothetical protein